MTNPSAAFADQPLISVIMSVYNAETYLAEAIESILAQTYSHFEFIIIDDGSTDGSVEIVRNFAARDARIRPLFLAHCNQAHALNTGVALVRGEWVAHMDNDDIALPQRLAAQLLWVRQTGADVCGSLASRFGRNERLLVFPEMHAAFQNELLFRCALLLPTAFMRTEIAKSHLFDEQAVFIDYELWTRLALQYNMGNVPQVLLKYRQHPQQVTVRKKEQMGNDIRKFHQRYARALFPQVSTEDYAALACVAEKKATANLGELESAANWLVRLAQTPDRFTRESMARRWLSVCKTSAYLGLDCYHLYWQIAPQFGLALDRGASNPLWLMCAVKLKQDSSLYIVLASTKQVVAKLPRLVKNILKRT